MQLPPSTPYLFDNPADHTLLHSFPTRRSSDLDRPEHPDQHALEHEGPPDEPVRRPDELHDLDLVATGVHRDPDRKSTRLNSSHANISYAVFGLKKKKGRVERGGSTRHLCGERS